MVAVAQEQSIAAKRSLALLMAIAILLIDFLSKALVHAKIPVMDASSTLFPYGGIAIFKNFLGIEFSISHATNRGAAWGILSQYQGLLVAVRVALVAGLAAYFLPGIESAICRRNCVQVEYR